MYSKLKLSELKNTNFKTKHHFLYKIVKVLEVANFTFLANFRFLTLILLSGASSFTEAMRMGSEVYHNLKSVIKKKYGQDACNVGDEGGFAPNIQSNKEGWLHLYLTLNKVIIISICKKEHNKKLCC